MCGGAAMEASHAHVQIRRKFDIVFDSVLHDMGAESLVAQLDLGPPELPHFIRLADRNRRFRRAGELLVIVGENIQSCTHALVFLRRMREESLSALLLKDLRIAPPVRRVAGSLGPLVTDEPLRSQL
jgi:hypothetical protein